MLEEPNHKIKDWDKFKEFAKTYGDRTQKQMAVLWGGEISDHTMLMVTMNVVNAFMPSNQGEEVGGLI